MANTSTPGGEIRDVPGSPTPGYFLAPAPRCSHCDCARKRGELLPCVQQTESLIRSIGPETVYPDLMTLGKGMSGAAMPAAGVVARKEIGAFFSERRWWLSSTMAAHPVAMAAVAATIEAMLEERSVENAATQGTYLGTELRKLAARHPSVGYVDGCGLLWMVELVKNKRTGERFVADDRFTMGAGDLDGWPVEIVTRHCLERGVFLTGLVPNTLALAPPLNVSREECDQALSALDSALSELDAGCDHARRSKR